MSILKPNTEGFGNPVHLLSPNDSENLVVSAILNEAKHVYEWHKEGIWASEYKDGFARLLAPYILAHPKLIRKIIDLDDRVFSMIAYRAAELENKTP